MLYWAGYTQEDTSTISSCYHTHRKLIFNWRLMHPLTYVRIAITTSRFSKILSKPLKMNFESLTLNWKMFIYLKSKLNWLIGLFMQSRMPVGAKFQSYSLISFLYRCHSLFVCFLLVKVIPLHKHLFYFKYQIDKQMKLWCTDKYTEEK